MNRRTWFFDIFQSMTRTVPQTRRKIPRKTKSTKTGVLKPMDLLDKLDMLEEQSEFEKLVYSIELIDKAAKDVGLW